MQNFCLLMHKTQPKGRNSAQLEDLGIWQSQTGRVWGRVGVVPGVCLVRQSVLAVPDGGRVWAMVTAWIDFQVGSSQGGLATEPEEMTRSPRD